jgi:hypothetical protein
MLTSTTTLKLPSFRPTTTAVVVVVTRPQSRLAQIVARQRASQVASRLFAVGIVAFAILIALAIAG